ncbi:universal stress protein [Flavobacterium sp. UBA6031]|uniref:universal stress protein n=1 Tax=Flavobacterium sp. UBA6031 TaxID=1946551 RepID=UPI0025C411BD|nr:universal stress protein [Flavobacterium sp. UBA6031]
MKTNNYKKVLIALDLDPTAQKVAEIGYELAKSMGAKVILLHTLVDAVYYSSIENYPLIGFTGSVIAPMLIQGGYDSKKESQNYLDKIKTHLGEVSIETIVKEGDCADLILKTSEELHADVIVMGSHSKRWLEEILMGSVTEKVLHLSSIPLFIIPTKNKKNNL